MRQRALGVAGCAASQRMRQSNRRAVDSPGGLRGVHLHVTQLHFFAPSVHYPKECPMQMDGIFHGIFLGIFGESGGHSLG